MATVSRDYGAVCTIPERTATLDTTLFFDQSEVAETHSPLDQFLSNCLRLNALWLKATPGSPLGDILPEFANLLLLGYVSAVEGYMRSLIRRLIRIDPFMQQTCESFQVSFAAAIHHSKDQLPEALLEETAFSSKKELSSGLTKFIGFQSIPKSLVPHLDQYEQICQLRHCCVHRFGRLGAKNAVALGLGRHSGALGRSITIRRAHLEDITDVLFTLVKAVNNEVCGFILERAATAQLTPVSEKGVGWTWKWASDKRRFSAYYDVFATTLDAQKTPAVRELYSRYASTFSAVGKKVKA
ncbi:hypothetical protein D9X30_0579 [Cupriavidus sp. U2]|nr:hypothetical protein D9X30_0579 [Cupriavidus sp. U2]